LAFYKGADELLANWKADKTWKPALAEHEREKLCREVEKGCHAFVRLGYKIKGETE